MKVLIADSGSTKTDWCLTENGTPLLRLRTKGLNPVLQTEEELAGELQDLDHRLGDVRPAAIHFYGAGCIPSRIAVVEEALAQALPGARIEVGSDMLGAARSLCGHRAGIACILGTGSNSCLYDGQRIVRNIPPLGYILGDEGSGACLGKHFLADCMKGILPTALYDGLLDELKETPASILERVYRRPHANRFLSGIVPYIYRYKGHSEVHDFLTRSFREFFHRNVLPYQSTLPVSFTGSVAWFFQDEIKETAASLNLITGLFVKNPIGELADYHFKTNL